MVSPIFDHFELDGQDTPVAPLKTLLMVVQALPGENALSFQIHCMEQLCRVFAGDPSLKPELDMNFANMRPEDRRDLLKDVPGAAPVQLDTDEASTSAPAPAPAPTPATPRSQRIAPGPPSLAWQGNDGCMTYSPEDIVHVAGYPLLKVLDRAMDMFVPPGFDRRLVFYILFHGYDVHTQLALYEYGWTDDLLQRMKDHVRAHGFPTSRPQVLIATGDSFPKKVEDPAKSIFASIRTKVGTNTESFFSTPHKMIERARLRIRRMQVGGDSKGFTLADIQSLVKPDAV